METKDLIRPTEIAKNIMKAAIKRGDIAIDATMGNGNDTLFLAQLVGVEGKVFAFDIQHKAMINTEKMIVEKGLEKIATLILDGHQNVDQYVVGEVSGVMFNLGYLPKGNHQIITKPQTTIIAVGKCLKLLKPGGVITILVYHGHPGGRIEKEELFPYIENLDSKQFHVIKMDFINQKNTPPLLVIIIKK